MAYLLRILILLSLLSLVLVIVSAHGWISLHLGHIKISIPVFIAIMFIQSFTMFYFIGVEKMTANVVNCLQTETRLEHLFDNPPSDLRPYMKQVSRMYFEAKLCKRQTIPWIMLTLVLGMTAFLLGGAHDTGLVEKTIHSGVSYGLGASLCLGFFRQWHYLGKAHRLLYKLKALFEIPHGQM